MRIVGYPLLDCGIATPNQNHHGATNNVNVLDIFCVERNALQWLVWSLGMRVSQLVSKARQLASFSCCFFRN